MKKLALCIGLLLAAGTSFGQPAQTAADIEAMKQQLQAVQRTRQDEATHLANFDDLDFNVYTGQKWSELARSHSKNIVVHYADGSVTVGLDAHIEQLKPMFVFAPDTAFVSTRSESRPAIGRQCKASSKAPSPSPCQAATDKRLPPQASPSGCPW